MLSSIRRERGLQPAGRMASPGSGVQVLAAFHRSPTHELGLTKDKVWTVRFDPQGRYLITGSEGGRAIIWDTDTWRVVTRLQGHDEDSTVRDADFHPTDQIVATAAGSTVRLWDVQTSNLLLELTGHDSAVMSVRWSPDGRRLLTSSYDGSAIIYDMPWEDRAAREILAELSPDDRARVEAEAAIVNEEVRAK